MFSKRLQILILTCAFALRYDVGMLVDLDASAARAAQVFCVHDSSIPVADERTSTSTDEDFESSGSERQNDDSNPPEGENTPGLPDDSDESESQEECQVESKLEFESVRHLFGIEIARTSFKFVPSRTHLTHLRI